MIMDKSSHSKKIAGKARQSVPGKTIAGAGPVASDGVNSTRGGLQLRTPEGQVIAGCPMEDFQRIRLKLVNRIRRLINRAGYTIDAEKIAQRMLEEVF
jgi:anti-sigma28 factor (negative regulator of flagellin synthesis)